ncbi:MAG: hypothetical protein BKP49_03835 [Treponema sp. CETP13]|nr:MAG: hypothetical protein BKP49_03835 [Treponema sp. CETP13]
MKIAIIGNGPAGFYCAERLIKNSDSDITVSIFDKEQTSIYSKIRLPDFIAGKIDKDTLLLKTDTTSKIDFHHGEEVISIDSVKKTIKSKKDTYTYDKLILAMGGYPFIPPIPGSNLENVFALRTLSDAKKIREKALKSKTAVIIGGGVLGLELAVALDSLGVKVSVVEVMPRLLANVLSEEDSVKLAKKMKESGIVSYVDQALTLLEKEGNSLKLSFKDNKEPLIADMVIFNTGIRCQTNLSEGDIPQKGRGFIVDTHFLTSLPDVYGIGDCAEHDGKPGGLWVSAKSQGEYLADILTGKKNEYDFPAFPIRIKLPFKI